MNTNQTDIFDTGATDSARSLAPHHDPERVGAIQARSVIDRDYVGDSEVGKFGNNRAAIVVEVLDRVGVVLWGETVADDVAATRLCRELEAKLNRNRQRELFA